jgi:uncharacterized protein YbjQ (UPF0145 family)
MATCPNCGAELKKAVFGGNLLYNEKVTSFIHDFTDSKAPAYCEKCGKGLIDAGKKEVSTRQNFNKATLNENINYVPLVSLQAPPEWAYKPLGLITGQSVTGTGVFSEFASDWTDFFGTQSKSYNKKISGGEQICQTQLRLKCIEMGGNAILGVDIDYAEVGGGKGMLMVCMTGTAVLLENPEVLGMEAIEAMIKVTATAKNNRAIRNHAALIENNILHGLTVPLAN